MAAISQGEVHSAVAKVKILINAQLKQILKREGLPVSGVKVAMQERIIRRKSNSWVNLLSIFYLPNILRYFMSSSCTIL